MGIERNVSSGGDVDLIIQGWLFDCYPSKRGMTFWMKTENGEMLKLHDSTWRNRIYAHGDAADDPDFLQSRLARTSASRFVSSVKFVYKKADLRGEVQKVLAIELSEAGKTKQVAEDL